MKRILAVLLLAASTAQADPTRTALAIAPDEVECIQETVWHDWGSESAEVKQFYMDAHIAGLLAVYAGVQAGIYDPRDVETAYGWYGCDWQLTLDLVYKVTYDGAAMVASDRGTISLDFLRN